MSRSVPYRVLTCIYPGCARTFTTRYAYQRKYCDEHKSNTVRARLYQRRQNQPRLLRAKHYVPAMTVTKTTFTPGPKRFRRTGLL